MNVVLHIGTEKTGTTSIQQFLEKNAKRLDSFGYHVLNLMKHQNQRLLASYCISPSRSDDFFAQRRLLTPKARENFRNDVRKALDKRLRTLGKHIHTVIISSEHFHSRLRSQIEVDQIKELIAPYFSNVRILCYVREQAELANSAYSTTLRSGGVIGIRDFLNSCTPENLYYNHSRSLEIWSDTFGTQSLQIRLFEQTSFTNGSLISDFLSAIEPSLVTQKFESVDQQNESISQWAKVVLRGFNLVSNKYTPKGKLDNSSRHTRRKIIEAYGGEQGTIVSRADYDQIFNTFSPSNCDLAVKYLGSSENPFSYNPPADSADIISDRYAETLADLIRGLKKCSYFSNSDADTLRDAAIAIENEDIKLAHKLMLMAQLLRPNGDYIREKVQEYEEQLGEHS